MPLAVDENLPTQFPKPDFLTLDNFKRGVITIIDKSRLPRNAAQEMKNMTLVEDGMPSPRPGMGWYGDAIVNSGRSGSAIVTTNLITNPSIETNTTGWSANVVGSGGTLTRVNTQAFVGTWSLQVAGGAGNGSASVSITTVVGQYYAIQAMVKTTNVGEQVFLDADATGTTGVSVTGTSGWIPITYVIQATSTTTVFYFQSNTGANKTFFIDAAMVELGTVASTYFSGDTADTTSTDYSWTGSVNGSTSTRSVYTVVAGTMDGFDYFDFAGAIHLVCVVGGQVYRSLDDANTWDACTGANMTSAVDVHMNQNGSFLYITNGVDDLIRYDGTTTLQVYTSLSTPVAPTTAKTGLAGTNFTYYYKIAAVNPIGFSIASLSGSIQTLLQRDSWDNTANFVTLTLPAPVATQTRADIFISDDDINYYYLDSIVTSVAVPNVTYRDNGTAIPVPSTLAPTGNTTLGPKVAELVNVGSRQYGVRDPQNRYRIWFTGTGAYSGAFSNSYDGGYLDWQPGGKYIPVHVEDYRDGKGTPLATVWCSSADGQGCILQMTLDVLTIQDISITVPSAYKLPGSRGTNAPGSVVNVLNDYMFYNTQAYYNLGSRQQFLNLLSTDEASANIRPTVKEITTSAAGGIASVYSDGKVFFSVPRGSDVNNTTDMYDTERKAWVPDSFTVGFRKFLRYTDQNGKQRLLATKPGDNQLTEISDQINGDYGQPFTTNFYTGLYNTDKNRFEYQWVEEGEIELSNPQGNINVELLGIERTHGFSAIKSRTIEEVVSTSGWDSLDWDSVAAEWDDPSDAPDTFSASSVSKYFIVQKELKAVQWHISTSSLDAKYVLRTLQTWGTATEGGHPRQDRL